MNCLILAAGHGSRLREVSDSKPLTPVAGAPLIEHVVRAAMAAGATRSIVVTGHQPARVEAFLAGLAARLGTTIECVRVADWDRPNGHSVLAGAARIDGDYLLLMSDHLFDPALARRLIENRPADSALTLAIDRDWRRASLDLDDATKVASEGDRIIRIGKALDAYDAVDTGVFVATPALAEALEAVIAGGEAGSLSQGVQRLADHGLAAAVDVTGLMWLDVDDPVALAKAEKLLAQG